MFTCCQVEFSFCMKSSHTLSIRYDYRLKFYNMKKNINMNTLTNYEKQVKQKNHQTRDAFG